MSLYSPRQVTAIHEAGHACAAVAQGIHVFQATIKPDSELNGRVTWRHSKSDSVHSHLVVAMAGPIAAHHAMGMPCSFHQYPQDQKVIRDLVGGGDERQSPIFQRALLSALDFVRQRQYSIHRVAKLLLDRTTVRHSEIAQAM